MKLCEFIDNFVPVSTWYQVTAINNEFVECFYAKSVNQIMNGNLIDKSILEKEVICIAPKLKTVESNSKISYESFINITVK